MNGRWQVVGDFSALLAYAQVFDAAFVSIGNCRVRWAKHQALLAAGIPIATVIHPRAYISQFARLGIGSIAMAGVVINADVGDGGIVNTDATIDHDCILDNGVHVSPGAHLSGSVSVGKCSWIAVGASIKQGITVGSDAIVGAGAVVVRPVRDGVTVMGCPAREQRV